MGQKEMKYVAFISYKSEDVKWAKWLQDKLEHYHIPSALRNGREDIPEYVRPVFRDRTDLSAGRLEKAISDALEVSHFLIVICSPIAAQSPWVCKEVQFFIDSGREDNIIPFIIDGQPNSTDPAAECFPEALRLLTGNRERLGINVNENGKEAAFVKVVATILDIDFDALWQRFQRQEKTRRRNINAILPLLEKGGRVSCDKAVAADCYRQAAEFGDTRAMYRQALLEMKQDLIASADLMRQAARLGNNEAAWWLAKSLFYGTALPRDYDEAFCWLQELSLRDGLSPKARLLKGLCHYNGCGTPIDYEAAVKTLLGAFESSGLDRWGVPRSESHDTGKMESNGLDERGVRTICRILGECHYYGKGVPKDYCRALKYLLLSVKDGEYIYPNKDAEYLIGTCYYFHLGTRQDIPTALFWLKDAEEQGSMEAHELLKRRACRQAKK